MTGNDYKRVNRGDRLAIPAPTWNALMGLLQPNYIPKRSNPGSTIKGLYTRNPYIASTIRVRNDHTAIGPYSVLGIETTTIINPATSANTLQGWKEKPTVAGDLPALATHLGKFVVTLEYADASAFVTAVASGIVAVQIDVLDADHRYADVKDADAAKLQSRAMGAARIIWKESGTGTKWAIVNIGVLPPALFPVQVDQTGGSAGNATTQCSFTYTVRDLSGYQIGTGMTPLKRRPAVGAMSAVDPSFGWGTGFYDTDGTFKLWDANETLLSEACA